MNEYENISILRLIVVLYSIASFNVMYANQQLFNIRAPFHRHRIMFMSTTDSIFPDSLIQGEKLLAWWLIGPTTLDF